MDTHIRATPVCTRWCTCVGTLALSSPLRCGATGRSGDCGKVGSVGVFGGRRTRLQGSRPRLHDLRAQLSLQFRRGLQCGVLRRELDDDGLTTVFVGEGRPGAHGL